MSGALKLRQTDICGSQKGRMEPWMLEKHCLLEVYILPFPGVVFSPQAHPLAPLFQKNSQTSQMAAALPRVATHASKVKLEQPMFGFLMGDKRPKPQERSLMLLTKFKFSYKGFSFLVFIIPRPQTRSVTVFPESLRPGSHGLPSCSETQKSDR